MGGKQQTVRTRQGPHHVAVKSTASSLPSGLCSALANSSGVSSCRTMQSAERSTVGAALRERDLARPANRALQRQKTAEPARLFYITAY